MLLALDTATTTASIALYDQSRQQLLAEYTWEARRRQTQDLLATTEEVLAQMALSPSDLTALAVTTGPGSFTGVRIGISTVKGIGLGLPTLPKVIGMPTLSVTAAPWLELMANVALSARLCTLIQAGRGRYNWVFFTGTQLLWRPSAADHAAGKIDDLVNVLQDDPATSVWVVGEVDAALADALTPLAHVTLLDAVSGWRRAGQLARLAHLHLAGGVGDDLSSLEPLYLRSP